MSNDQNTSDQHEHRDANASENANANANVNGGANADADADPQEVEVQNIDYFDSDELYPDREFVEKEIPGLGLARLRVFTYGAAEKFMGDGETMAELDGDTIADILSAMYERPALDLSGEDVRGMKAMVPAKLLKAVMEASEMDGEVEMHDDGSATVNLDGEVGN